MDATVLRYSRRRSRLRLFVVGLDVRAFDGDPRGKNLNLRPPGPQPWTGAADASASRPHRPCVPAEARWRTYRTWHPVPQRYHSWSARRCWDGGDAGALFGVHTRRGLLPALLLLVDSSSQLTAGLPPVKAARRSAVACVPVVPRDIAGAGFVSRGDAQRFACTYRPCSSVGGCSPGPRDCDDSP